MILPAMGVQGRLLEESTASGEGLSVLVPDEGRRGGLLWKKYLRRQRTIVLPRRCGGPCDTATKSRGY